MCELERKEALAHVPPSSRRGLTTGRSEDVFVDGVANVVINPNEMCICPHPTWWP